MRARREIAVTVDWTKLLSDAVQIPGIISSAYSQFWNYSVGNQLLAWFECHRRGIALGPINTFRGWVRLERYVRKGEKAITLCMPVSVKKRSKKVGRRSPNPAGTDAEEESQTTTVFVYKSRWFVLSQTEGKPYTPTELPHWSEDQALKTLAVERIAFTHLDGNCQGFARQRQISVSPLAKAAHETLFHELAHVVLGHTQENHHEKDAETPRSLREVEAESVALICCEALALTGAAECRGYIQHWLAQGAGAEKAIPSASVHRIFKAADAILKAGYPQTGSDFQGSPW